MKTLIKRLAGMAVFSLVILAAGPGLGSSVHPVLEQERGFIGATHVATITRADLTETNVDTAQTLTNVLNVTAKQRVELIGMELITAFNAGNNATGSVLVTVGDGAAGADFYLDSTELDSNKTEVWTKFGRAYQGVTTEAALNVTNVSQETVTLDYSATNDPAVTLVEETAEISYATTNDPTLTPETVEISYATTNDPTVTLSEETAEISYATTNDPTLTPETVEISYATTNDPAVTLSEETAEISYATTNDPTLTPETVEISYATTNDPVVTLVFETVLRTNYFDPVIQTNASGALTNITWTTVVDLIITNATATATLTEGTVTPWTNATASLTEGTVTPWTNATATATLTEGTVTPWTNATATLTEGTVTPWTNATATATLTEGTVTPWTNAAASLTEGTVTPWTNATATATLTAGAAVEAVTNVSQQTESQTRVTALTDSASGRKVYTSDDTIDFVFTPNSENALSENTAGEVRFYFKVIR